MVHCPRSQVPKASVFCVRLKSFYQREWDKVHQIYQEEADKCCMLMEEQVRTYLHTRVCKCAEPYSVYKILTMCVRIVPLILSTETV